MGAIGFHPGPSIMRAALGKPLTHKAQNCQQQSLAAPMLISVLWAHGLALGQFVYDGLDQLAQFGFLAGAPVGLSDALADGV